MKRVMLFIIAALMLVGFAACSPSDSGLSPTVKPSAASATPVSTPTVTPNVKPTIAPTATPVVTPTTTPAATPTATPFGETPDSAGTGDVRFDIYQHQAGADINADGTAEKIEFAAGTKTSKLTINGKDYTVNLPALAQCFAITDVDSSDKYLELCFTEKYRELADSEVAYSYLYWWNGSKIIRMGSVDNLKFDSGWRASLSAKSFFDAHGTVMYVTRTTALTDVWYTAHFLCDGADRKLVEDTYTTDPLYKVEPLTLKKYLVVLKEIDSKYFDPATYGELWDYGGSYGAFPREHSDSVVSFIPRAGEKLTIIRLHGPYWFKVKASDGKMGWLKCKDGKVQGVYQVMGYTASDLFDGIVIAG